MFNDQLVLIKGAGDLATGIAWRLQRSGFSVAMTEIERPLVVRRRAAFAQAVFDGETTVEGITARRCVAEDVPSVLAAQEIPVVVDPAAALAAELAPTVLVDAIMAKVNTGTGIEDAPLVIDIGPGFTAQMDCHYVIETHRGHTLGRVLAQGAALPDTRTPGALPGLGVDATRVLRAPVTGRMIPHVEIGGLVAKGEIIAGCRADDGSHIMLTAPFDGVLRGLVHQSVPVTAGMKIGDLDPRAEPFYAWTISDKSLAIGGGVLEAILYHFSQTLA